MNTLKDLKYSFVVYSYNSENSINKCLESLINLKYPKEQFEIIIADVHSHDRSL
ncbi:MAG: glycosyltransferase, partial [Calditrichia bacterium]|nr:glycosyltransferase [Calditrichia bacterium]